METPAKPKQTHDQIDTTSPAEQRESSTPHLEPPSTPLSSTEVPSGEGAATTRQGGQDVQDETPDTFDPKIRIEDFEWRKLEEGFHSMIQEQHQKESQLFEEFAGLNAVSDSGRH